MLRRDFEELQKQNELIFHIVNEILKRMEYISTFSPFEEEAGSVCGRIPAP